MEVLITEAMYKNMNLDAQLDHMTFMANGGIIDPNIHLTFEARVIF
ncbi:MAG: hypothetical protein IPJ13_00965 [Saprospiraceae bacterium]|nr:hypothetical protein [Saprospiraceae bacterium]